MNLTIYATLLCFPLPMALVRYNIPVFAMFLLVEVVLSPLHSFSEKGKKQGLWNTPICAPLSGGLSEVGETYGFLVHFEIGEIRN